MASFRFLLSAATQRVSLCTVAPVGRYKLAVPFERALTRLIAALLALCLQAGFALAQQPVRDRVVQLDIPRQQADGALTALGQQADITVLYRYDVVRPYRTNVVSGQYRLAIAVVELLKNTRLKAEFAPSGHLIVTRIEEDEQVIMVGKEPKKTVLATVISALFGAAATGQVWGQGGAEAGIEEVVVTGSRLARGNEVSPSPVTTVNAGAIEARGTIRIEDLLNILPQISPSETASKANEATGTATIDLRGLGAERTLALVNGRRLPYGSPIAAAADVNQVPAQLIERVDVLTGGASAVYGADAVAGVVNFILKDDFEGIEVDFQAAAFQSENDNSAVRSVLNEFNQRVPGSTMDGESYNLNIIAGVRAPDDRGNFTSYFTYRKQEAVLQGERIGSACAFGSRNQGQEFTCAGSGTSFPAQFAPSARVPNPYRVTLDESGAPRDFIFPNDTYNFAPINNYIQPNERYAFGALGHFQINGRIEAYMELGFSDNTITDQIAPSGIFFGQTDTINCDNPLLTPDLVELFCASQGFSQSDDAPLNIGRRNVEGGGRANEISHTSYRIVAGLRGDINEAWSYDASAQYSKVAYTDEAENFFNISLVKNALEVRTDPKTGKPACQAAIDGADSRCVPYNVFQPGGVTQEALDYIQAPGFRKGSVTQKVFQATASGDLGVYNMRSPFANDGVSVVLGIEYREDSLTQTNDFLTRTGALGNPRANVAGEVPVREFFTEVQVPLAQGRRLVKDLSVTGAYRYSDYFDTTGKQSTYALGLSYAPSTDIRLRAQYQRAIRSPNPIELFSPQNRFEFNLPELPNGAFDPCAGANPLASAEQCARTGVSAAQYGNILTNPGGQFNNLTGGNKNLDVETSDTYTAGVVFTPGFLPNLSLSIDWFNIRVDDFIATIPEQTSLNNCLQNNDPLFCGQIVRDPVNGRLWGNEGAYVIATNINTGSLETSGLDITGSYELPMGVFGSLRIDYIATFLDSLEKTPLPGEPAFECAGFFSPTRAQCGVSSPEYRHQIPLTWRTDWNGVSAMLTWRHFGEVEQFGTTGDTLISFLGARDYIDLSARAIIGDVDVRLGINNVLDKQPPLSNQVGGAGGSFGTGNTFPGVYDALGRFLFLAATFTF